MTSAGFRILKIIRDIAPASQGLCVCLPLTEGRTIRKKSQTSGYDRANVVHITIKLFGYAAEQNPHPRDGLFYNNILGKSL